MSRQVFVALRYGSMPILGLGLLQVRAGESPGEDMTPTTLVKPKDFPVYSEPKQTEYQLIPEGPSALRDMVGSVREQIWRFSDTFHGAISFTQRTYKTAEETSKSVIQFIKTEEGFYPRAGVISIAGLAGLVLARKGGFIRKVVYSGGLMTATASLCYPYQAVRIGKAEIEWVKTKAADLYKGDTSSPAVEKVAATEVKKEDESESSNQEDSLKTDESTSNASLEDHGQSKPEDKDMYTTRS
ncbi:MICOS complex subunit MIC27-like isoform X1 [Lytechinus variegatus]|uniref:MICOS complex subunit MIC27-like isoform X1 n=1 Tax=Lytechinus variegatus TaxID=7654 RepID=UPI001BB190CF|nr:MICOS complex subunit MIC27-like isoform X1 [Lytechinus variegatus]